MSRACDVPAFVGDFRFSKRDLASPVHIDRNKPAGVESTLSAMASATSSINPVSCPRKPSMTSPIWVARPTGKFPFRADVARRRPTAERRSCCSALAAVSSGPASGGGSGSGSGYRVSRYNSSWRDSVSVRSNSLFRYVRAVARPPSRLCS